MGSNDDLLLKTIESCKKVCKTAFYASLWSGILSPIFFYIVGTGALGTEIQLQMWWFDWTVIVQSVIFIIAWYYTMKGSRVAAVILFLLFAAGKISMMISMWSKWANGIFFWLIYGYAVVASFKWNNLLKKDNESDSNIENLHVEFVGEDNDKIDNKSWNNIKTVVIVLFVLWCWIVFGIFMNKKEDQSINNSAQEVVNFINQNSNQSGASNQNTEEHDRDAFIKRSEYLSTWDIEKELLQLEQSIDEDISYNAKFFRANFYGERWLYEVSNILVSELISNTWYVPSDYSNIYMLKCLNYYHLDDFKKAKIECDRVDFNNIGTESQNVIILIEKELGNEKRFLELIDQALIKNPDDIILLSLRLNSKINDNLNLEEKRNEVISDATYLRSLLLSWNNTQLDWAVYDETLWITYVYEWYIQLLRWNKKDGCENAQKSLNLWFDLVDNGFEEVAKICNLK